MDVIIQPYYFLDLNRRSHKVELARMKAITEKIKDNPKFKAKIQDIILVDISEVMKNIKNKEISDSYKYCKQKYKLGT